MLYIEQTRSFCCVLVVYFHVLRSCRLRTYLCFQTIHPVSSFLPSFLPSFLCLPNSVQSHHQLLFRAIFFSALTTHFLSSRGLPKSTGCRLSFCSVCFRWISGAARPKTQQTQLTPTTHQFRIRNPSTQSLIHDKFSPSSSPQSWFPLTFTTVIPLAFSPRLYPVLNSSSARSLLVLTSFVFSKVVLTNPKFFWSPLSPQRFRFPLSSQCVSHVVVLLFHLSAVALVNVCTRITNVRMGRSQCTAWPAYIARHALWCVTSCGDTTSWDVRMYLQMLRRFMHDSKQCGQLCRQLIRTS